MNRFNELKRRNVFRAAGLYIVVGWALAQAAALLKGDVEAASAHFTNAMDFGARYGFVEKRLFSSILPDDPRIDALPNRVRRLIDAERESLGLAPLALPKG